MKVLRDMGTQQKKSRHTIPANVPDSIADLYATDLQIDGCSSLALENTNIDAILDLYDTDREVDGVKVNAIQTEQEEIHMVLLKMDQLADLANVEDNVELVEPMTAQVLRQYEMQSQCLVHRYDTVNPDIFDLLCTDMEVDEHASQTKAMKTNEALLQVDQMVDQTVGILQFDEEIDNRMKVLRDMGTQQKKSRHTIPANVPDSIADLYATDLQIDGCSSLAPENTNIDAILDLYDTDREVDGVKVNAIQTEQEEMHMVLLKMDQLADLANVEDNVELVEPMTAQVLRQYEMQSQCLVHRYDTVNPDIFDLFCTDMEVDEHSSQTKAMKTNEALLQVDQMVDQTVGILQSHNYDLPSMVCTSDRKAQFDVSVL